MKRAHIYLHRRALAFGLCCIALASACALASGTDPKAGRTPAQAAADPDTQPLPPGSHWTLPDPKTPPPPPEPAAPPTATVAASDAGGGHDASAAVAAVAPKPNGKPGPATTAKPKPPPAAAATVACGTGGKLCPMQAFMRGQMAASKTPEALNAAFSRLARMSPNGGWAWASIAKKGAALAKSGDVKGAKQQCAACHSAYKAPYKAQYRGRKI